MAIRDICLSFLALINLDFKSKIYYIFVLFPFIAMSCTNDSEKEIKKLSLKFEEASVDQGIGEYLKTKTEYTNPIVKIECEDTIVNIYILAKSDNYTDTLKNIRFLTYNASVVIDNSLSIEALDITGKFTHQLYFYILQDRYVCQYSNDDIVNEDITLVSSHDYDRYKRFVKKFTNNFGGLNWISFNDNSAEWINALHQDGESITTKEGRKLRIIKFDDCEFLVDQDDNIIIPETKFISYNSTRNFFRVTSVDDTNEIWSGDGILLVPPTSATILDQSIVDGKDRFYFEVLEKNEDGELTLIAAYDKKGNLLFDSKDFPNKKLELSYQEKDYEDYAERRNLFEGFDLIASKTDYYSTLVYLDDDGVVVSHPQPKKTYVAVHEYNKWNELRGKRSLWIYDGCIVFSRWRYGNFYAAFTEGMNAYSTEYSDVFIYFVLNEDDFTLRCYDEENELIDMYSLH